MTFVDLLVVVFATVSLTRLLTHDRVLAPIRTRVLAAGAESTVMAPRVGLFSTEGVDVPPSPGRRYQPVENGDGVRIGWYRPPAWYVELLGCSRYCASFWAASAVAALSMIDHTFPRAVNLAFALRGVHATLWPVIGDQFAADE